jgi:hypothetical protein
MQEEKKITRIDSILHVRSKCSCCKKCWIALEGPTKGKCYAGGPFEGFTKRAEKVEAPSDGTMSEVSS